MGGRIPVNASGGLACFGEAVPAQAISMSCRQILATREIVCVVPDARKAVAVQAALEGPITPMVPASILREHPHVVLHLDEMSASLLSERTPLGGRRPERRA